MLTDYLIRCGVILQFVPPGANPEPTEPLPINPPAVIRQIDYQQEETIPELDELMIQQLIELRESVGVGALPDESSAAFERTLRAEFGEHDPLPSPPSRAQKDTVELLRTAGERMDAIANQLERANEYRAADDLRELAQRLRRHGRTVGR